MKNELSESKNKIFAQGSIEYMVVFSLLFITFVFVLDIALFFRQIYLVQTASDEILSRLVVGHLCSGRLVDNVHDGDDEEDVVTQINDFTETKETIEYVIKSYFSFDVALGVGESSNYGINFSTNDDKFNVALSCRNYATPDVVYFSYNYKGLLLYRNGKIINSNPSSNTSYF